MLLIEWFVRAALLSALLAVSALALEDVLATAKRATRFVWVAALLGSMVLPLTAVLTPEVWPEFLQRSADLMALPVASSASIPNSATTVIVDSGWTPGDLVAGLWLSASLLLMMRWLYGWQKLRKTRLRWREVMLVGERVLVSDRFGPAVVGLLRPRVVVPAWVLGDFARQRMIVRHEMEHARAGDQWLLALAPILAVLFPWNPAVWWQLRRLRLAVELDCDARVLRGGFAAFEYGSMLLDVASSVSVPRPTIAALSEPHTALERRIRAMTPIRYRYALARAASSTAAGVFALAGALLACAPEAPTAAAAQEQTASIVQAPQKGGPVIVLNGKLLEPTTKLDEIAVQSGTVVVLRPEDAMKKYGERGRFGAVVVTTRASDPLEAKTAKPAGGAASEATIRLRRERELEATLTSNPLVIVDGVVRGVGADHVKEINPDDIEKIEVVKGAAARVLYGDRAAAGVIIITTKH